MEGKKIKVLLLYMSFHNPLSRDVSYIVVRKLSDTTSLFYVIANVIVNELDKNINNFYKNGLLQKGSENK